MTETPTAPTNGGDVALPKAPRLMSLDALRGFDMFWIIGAEGLVAGLKKVSDSGPLNWVAHQLEHVAWEGFHFEDLIFPLFVFLVGVSLVFSLTRTIEEKGRSAAVLHILRRAVLLYLIGIIYYGGFSGTFEQIRLLGVLQRIAIAYLFAGLIFCFFDWRGRAVWCVGILVGYWLLMKYVPVPEIGAGNFDEGKNLANWIDSQYLPLRKWDGDHDPEGLLSTLPAIANCLLGVFAGMLLRDPERSQSRKVLLLIAAGAVLLAAGWGWSHDSLGEFRFPIIKKLWTSSYVLVACGYSCLLLAAFYLVIEIWNWRLWAMPFVWIGANPITIYLIHEIVDMNKLSQRFVGGELGVRVFGSYGELAVAIVGLAISLAICRFLYQRKVFIRL